MSSSNASIARTARITRLAWVLIGAIPASCFAAERLGTSYPIGEEAADQAIIRRLKDKERSGQLKALETEAAQRSLHSAKHPKAVAGITTASLYRAVAIDPSITYKSDVTDDFGKLIVKAGTRVNPLETLSLSKVLVFFDGSDNDQVAAVGAYMKASKDAVKPILVAGSWFELSKRWKQQVYHDQEGILTRRFGIVAVPAIVRQQGNRLFLQEIPTKDLRP